MKRGRVAAAGLAVAVVLAVAGCASPSNRLPSTPTSGQAQHAETHANGCTTSASAPESTSVLHLVVGHRDRTYRLSAPKVTTRPAPLIVAFHGRGQNGAELQRYSGLSGLAAWVAYPDGVENDGQRAWEGAPYASDANDISFTQQLISAVEQRACIDTRRIDAVGISNGGGFVALLACRDPSMFGAFAMVDGAFYSGTDSGCTRAPASILEFHGTADPVIHYNGGSGAGGAYPPITTWLRGWAATDRCQTSSTRRITSSVTRLTWSECAERTTVVHYRINAGGHTWPGAHAHSGPGPTNDSISATALIWKFFRDHSDPRTRVALRK